MRQMEINKLGPIQHVKITCNNFMVFTGAQSSGKSTVAKVMFFFRTVKDDILSLMIRKTSNLIDKGNLQGDIRNLMYGIMWEKFKDLFGPPQAMEKDMYLRYDYDDKTFIKITLRESRDNNYNVNVWIDFSTNILRFFRECDDTLAKYTSALPDEEKSFIRRELSDLFKDKYEILYIPAGRSMMTLLASQLNYIYATMEDSQKRAIDLCTRSYLEHIIKLKPQFENGLTGLENDNPLRVKNNKDILTKAKELAQSILKGSYYYKNGDERLEINANHYVKINLSSSGQQETVWILNLLFYHLLQSNPTAFIIEEPESHLFPEAQKLIMDFIALVSNAGHDMVITTHSPYVLGGINNLLFAGQTPDSKIEAADKIIDKDFWMQGKNLSGWFIKDGRAEPCVDDELGLIKNELIDEISGIINNDFDNLLDLNDSEEVRAAGALETTLASDGEDV